jgi:hypothetical protein
MRVCVCVCVCVYRDFLINISFAQSLGVVLTSRCSSVEQQTALHPALLGTLVQQTALLACISRRARGVADLNLYIHTQSIYIYCIYTHNIYIYICIH